VGTKVTTKASERLFRSQSAVSIALGRLREHYNDPLFVRKGPKLVPTEFALQLKQPLSRVLLELDAIVETSVMFEPASYNGEIVLAIPDNAQSLIASVVNKMGESAPGASVRIVSTALQTTDYDEGINQLLNGKLDLIMSFYRGDVPDGIELQKLNNQKWVVFARENHPISKNPSLEQWATYQHIIIESGNEGRSPITDMLANTPVKRKVGLKATSFLQALHLVSETEFLFTTMYPVIGPVANKLNLRQLVLPLSVPDVPFCVMTRTRQNDPLSDWLVEQVLACVQV